MEKQGRSLNRRICFLAIILGAFLHAGGETGRATPVDGIFAMSDSGPGIYPGATSLTAGTHLPDTGQTRCYDNTKEIACPGVNAPFFGQDAQYQGTAPWFRDNGDGTVSDLITGLMWQQGDAHNDWGFGWEEAVAYCSALILAGHTDWRIPTRRELISLVDYGRFTPAVDTRYFPNCYSDKYWSNTVTAAGPASAWEVNFSYGSAFPDGKVYALYVRCARNE